jgi:hypothetical protein
MSLTLLPALLDLKCSLILLTTTLWIVESREFVEGAHSGCVCSAMLCPNCSHIKDMFYYSTYLSLHLITVNYVSILVNFIVGSLKIYTFPCVDLSGKSY